MEKLYDVQLFTSSTSSLADAGAGPCEGPALEKCQHEMKI